MTWPRFFVEQLPELGTFELDESESRHASNVLRMSEGDACLAFDGLGNEASCKVHKLSKRIVELVVVERLDTNRELPKVLQVAVAIPKGDRQKTLVDFLVQLGVHSLQPLVTKRGVAQPVDSALARLRRSVIESCKQCGRNRLMQLLEPIDVKQMAQASQQDGQMRMFAHPYGDVAQTLELRSEVSAANGVVILIGPEGGFTEEEASLLRIGNWRAVSLGPRILRVEVAATYVTSWLAEIAVAQR